MCDAGTQLLPIMMMLIATGGCHLVEPLYVGELKTKGTWTGTASVVTLVPEGEGSERVQVAALHIAAGPKWSDPGHRSHENVIGKDAILIDENKRVFQPDKWPHGSLLRVRGLMKTDVAFDEKGRRLYPGPERKYRLTTIRVDVVELLQPG